jgi:hypothetical protein
MFILDTQQNLDAGPDVFDKLRRGDGCQINTLLQQLGVGQILNLGRRAHFHVEVEELEKAAHFFRCVKVFIPALGARRVYKALLSGFLLVFHIRIYHN